MRDAHERLLHPSSERLVGTFGEQGQVTTVAEVRRHLGECIVCSEKNAVHKKVPRSETRRTDGGAFNDTVWWDLGHFSDSGYSGQHTFSLMVDEQTLWWDGLPLNKKSDAPDHLLKWHHAYGPMQALRSDNAGELKGTRVQVICRDRNVYMVTTPPYTSAANGVVERAIRELRSLLRTALSVLALPLSIWPALLYGLCSLHNVMYSPTLGSSPFCRRYGFAPRLTPLVGDEVVLRPPSSKKDPKSLRLPGCRCMYIGEMNASTALVYDASKKTIVRVHPSQLLSYFPRSARPIPTCQLPEGQPSSSTPHVPSIPTRAVQSPSPTTVPDASGDTSETPQLLWFRRSSTSSSSSSAPSAAPPDCGALHSANVPAIPRLPGPEVSLPLESGGSAPPTASRAATRTSRRPAGSPPASPRLAGQHGLIAPLWGTPTVALVTSRARGSIGVSWLTRLSDNNWSERHMGTVLPSDVIHEFSFLHTGGVPATTLEALRNAMTLFTPTLNCSVVPHSNSPTSPQSSPWLADARYDRAVLNEFIAILRNGVIGAEASPRPRSMRMSWLLTEKLGDGGNTKLKARWVCKGFMDRSPYTTYAGTPSLTTFLVFLIYLLTRGWSLWLLDAANAFLQAPLPPDVHATIVLDEFIPKLPSYSPDPNILPEEWTALKSQADQLLPGQHRQVNKALYGDRRSPYVWHRTAREKLQAVGYEELAESLFVKRHPDTSVPSAIMTCHVDDFAMGGEDASKELEAVKSVIHVKQPSEVIALAPSAHLGMQVTRMTDCIHISHDAYLSTIDTQPGKSRKVDAGHLAAPSDEEIDASLTTEYKQLNGKLGWAVKTRPDQAVFFSRLSKFSNRPCMRLMDAMKRVIAAMKAAPSALIMRGLKGAARLSCFSDASFSLNNLECRVGHKIFLYGVDDENDGSNNENIIAWRTKEIKEKIDSSTSAELLGLKGAVKSVWEFVPVIESLWGERVPVEFVIDSKPLHWQLVTGETKAEPKMKRHLTYVLQELKALSASVRWVKREEQVADVMTKCVWFV
eukprot:GHVU01143884.1.p1 GENE.GHVU01143884.1~~GHVU01143884.1.p1  ORF type:complete len:1180 (+),score=96.66 GHVU01143884.1:451-3540(+)